ncbi:histidine kinase dimerization/phosphoacceptor domain -containing protein [Roseomonas sp. E05]|uniref:histidine kinase dimerization/phosphoacceptor domain -containing protein n=1 Tax=Roseomonas sp. E05 TaxID=3046310 RepID=UPI0024BAB265|nr:histidine kinase dimerization/phosphoacceptor domain -containing protein [Roseomonas sp. E05]MDJ0387999.1 histidine kinase dimerization/phosphoacceptor domain -containing protein [Roseomonas sp. E05]
MTRATPYGRAAERIVDLALAVFGTPAALACFVGPPAGLSLVQQGLDLAITMNRTDWQMLARRSGACVVEDAWQESWLAQHPLATGPAGIRFYAAAPLRNREGRQQGVLAILSPEPRPQGLAPQERARLQNLADMLMAEREAELRPDEAPLRLVEAERALRQRDAQLRNQAHIIQEMDHRIRNGLQMISDMLCLQSLAGQEEGLAARLNAAAGRVQAVAEVHALLQSQPGAGRLSARASLEGLLCPFRRLWQGSGRHVRLREGADMMVSALDAPRLGLVAWELLANAMRHGQGNVTLDLRADRMPHRLRIAVQDEGSGSERLLRATASTGCESGFGLIRLIAGGEAAQVRCGPPTEVSIVLDLPPAG